jgi:hypothetical protein
LATHRSAEPNTLVVRADLEERGLFVEDAAATYYLADYYRPYPLVLVRLQQVTRDLTGAALVLASPDPAEDPAAAACVALAGYHLTNLSDTDSSGSP